MFAIACCRDIAEPRQRCLTGLCRYCHTLTSFGFDRVQGGLYTTPSEDLANLFGAIISLKAMPWLPASVQDIRAFRVEQWSDFKIVHYQEFR
jgi:virulence-associated protein VapD